jgi:xanthine phosphoribosyltransferase
VKYYSYDDFREDTNLLLKLINTLDIDAIVGISRGGLTLAHCISEGLDIRDVQSLQTELYDDTQKRDKITLHNNCVFNNVKKVLIVDDISDSGDTLQVVMNELKSKYKNVEFKSATLFYKKTSIYEPDFWINETTKWIEFFWEKDFKKLS